MSTIWVSFIVFILLTAGAVGLVMLVFLRSRSAETNRPTPSIVKTIESSVALPFHLVDILLPAVVFFIALVATFIFFGQLPGQVAYHFTADGSGDLWISRGMLLTTMLLPQLLLVSLSIMIAIVMLRVGARFVREGKLSAPVLRGVISLMSNMIALPQLILLFAMMDIFLYNTYRFHLFPLYVFAILVMVLGGIVMAFFFFQAIRGSKTTGK